MLPSTMKGEVPRRVFIFTMPLLRSPYSTDGMPVTISTLSTLDADSMRVLAEVVSPAAALLLRRTPSMSMAVPKAAFPASPVKACNERRLSFISEGLVTLPPGRSEVMSAILMIC